MSTTAVEVTGLFKSFGARAVFENAGVRIEAGSVFGLVGLNGSGKTTFIRLLLGLLRPDRGSVRVIGQNPWLHKSDYYRSCGVILEHDGFAGNLTVRRNLRLFADARQIPWSALEGYIDEHWAGTFIYDEMRGRNTRVKHLSRGQKMQCGICRAFLPTPSVFFFDEPTVALDVDAIDHFYSLVKHARSRGATVIISSHQLPAIEELCDRVGMLHGHGISMLTPESGRLSNAPWLVRCGGAEEYRAIIENVVGCGASYVNGCWHFSVNNGDVAIPKIVSALVGAGCEIAEVRPDTDALKRMMKTVGGEGASPQS
jgi:ABC-2 type transport system ATP-binding protein